jgi:soluble lytic murein transglycosylase
MKVVKRIFTVFLVMFVCKSFSTLGIRINEAYINKLHNKITSQKHILDRLENKYQKVDDKNNYYNLLLSTYNILNITYSYSSDKLFLLELSNTIIEESEKNGFDPFLILAIINVESDFNNKALSYKGAMGLMQVKPQTAYYITSKDNNINLSNDGELFNPVTNIKIGINYLGYLNNKFNNNLKLALIAYNIGPGKLIKLIKSHKDLPKQYYRKVNNVYKRISEYNNKI